MVEAHRGILLKEIPRSMRSSQRYSFARSCKLYEIYLKLKDMYFPNHKNTSKGYLVYLDCSMCDLNLENLNLKWNT